VSDGRTGVALVTGASRGVGAAIARRLSQEGLTVGVNFLEHEEAAANVVREIEAAGGRALAIRADVRDEEALRVAARYMHDEVGPITVLVHNAGARLQPAKFADVAWDDFQQHFDVAVRGAVNACRACLPGMAERRHGAVVFVASAAAHAVPPPQWSSYVTAKAALRGLARALAVEYGAFGVRVNSVSPGMVPTELTAFVPDRMKQMIAQQTPLKRLASGEDVAGAVAFLASEAGAYVTGVDLPIAGGTVMD
jgi:3-oxoacyl-[acyl-carrier protein] reductase